MGLVAQVFDESHLQSLQGHLAVGHCRVAGRARARDLCEGAGRGIEGFSPTVRVFINQDALEPLLHERALELGATVRGKTTRPSRSTRTTTA